MNLKEAFRYQNKLNDLIDTVEDYLGESSNVMKTTVEHLRKKANPAAENEIVDTTAEREYPYSINDMMKFLVEMVEEKELLYSHILEAKRNLDFDMDSQIDLNIKRQSLSRLFRNMGNIRSTETIQRAGGRDYTFNQEGNQTVYCYDLKVVSVIDFDRNRARKQANDLIKQADEASAKIDQIMVNTTVEYEPFFDVNDSFEEVFDSWLES